MISIVIIHFGKKEFLFSCIESIEAHSSKAVYEIIVVDNDEKNKPEKDLKKRFPRVSYIKSENIGYGAGCNLGAKYAGGEYLFFLNPDTVLFKDTIKELFNFISKKNNVGAVSPLLVKTDGTPQDVIGSQFPTPLRAVFSLSLIHKFFPNNTIANKFFLKKLKKDKPFAVDVFPGTGFMIKKQMFEEVGGFDENYFLFYEEADLAKQLTEKGYKNYIVPEAKIIHIGGASTKKRNDINRIFAKSRFYYFKKWHGFFPALFLELFLRFKKEYIFLGLIFLLALFLRVYKLDSTMTFIGDQGWFYLSARDAVLNKEIPLVGITSSHTWLHQGPYWTYIVAFLFWIFNFNPMVPAYFTAFLGALTIWLIYKVSKELFLEKFGLISAAIYATSPLIIANDRFAYHTSPIPFFTLIFIFCVYKWTKGNYIFFAPALITLGVLYNFELATASLFGVLFIFLFYGIIRRKSWAVKIFER
ncbi:MAG: glycosyltransferase, partial [Patescibacteria group bacterium]